MIRLSFVFTCAAILAGVVTTAGAAPLNLVQQFPDVLSISNAVTFDAITGTFTATGRPLTLSTPTVYNITNTTTTSYNLTAIIDAGGNALSGTLTIGGKIGAPINAASGTLLTGTLSQFGYGAGVNGDPFEFVFDVTGGDLAGIFGPKAGVIISAKSTNFAGWTTNFSSGSGATNDTFMVPEPATLIVMLGGSLLTLVRRRNG